MSDESNRQRTAPAAEGKIWPKVTLPNKFVNKPYQTKPNAQGKTYTMVIVDVPKGTEINDIEIGGFKARLFMGGYQMKAKAEGRPVTFSMNPNDTVKLWKGDGENRIELNVKPWDFTQAIKAQREAYAAAREQEREEGPLCLGQAEPEQSTPKDGAEVDNRGDEPEGIDELSEDAFVASDYYASQDSSSLANPTIGI